jgi:hypothetical protein
LAKFLPAGKDCFALLALRLPFAVMEL